MKNILFILCVLMNISYSQAFSEDYYSEIDAIWKILFSGRHSAYFSYIKTSDNNIWFINYAWEGYWPVSIDQDAIRQKWNIGDTVKLTQESKDWEMTNLSKDNQTIRVWGPFSSLKESFEIGEQRDPLFIPYQGKITYTLDNYKGKVNIINSYSNGKLIFFLQLKDDSKWRFQNPKDISDIKNGEVVYINFEWGHTPEYWQKFYLKKGHKTFEILPLKN